jgi:hypothetical protein
VEVVVNPLAAQPSSPAQHASGRKDCKAAWPPSWAAARSHASMRHLLGPSSTSSGHSWAAARSHFSMRQLLQASSAVPAEGDTSGAAEGSTPALLLGDAPDLQAAVNEASPAPQHQPAPAGGLNRGAPPPKPNVPASAAGNTMTDASRGSAATAGLAGYASAGAAAAILTSRARSVAAARRRAEAQRVRAEAASAGRSASPTGGEPLAVAGPRVAFAPQLPRNASGRSGWL